MTLRAVLDTNVIVSGLGWSGPSARIVDAVLAGRCTLLSSTALLDKLQRVLAYPKLAAVFLELPRFGGEFTAWSGNRVLHSGYLLSVTHGAPGTVAVG